MSAFQPWLQFAFLWIAAALSAVYVLKGNSPARNAIICIVFLALALLRVMTIAGHGSIPL